MKKLLSGCLLVLACSGLQAQTRYLDDVFTRAQVQFSNDVEFGQNFYFLNYPPAPAGTSGSNPQMGPLQMDVFSPPNSDTAQARPLVILIHTGSFLPKYFNGYPVGKNDDSTIVELANRFVMKGYMVAAPNYRLGWNPLASTQVERTAQILNAVYRAIHDAQTCVRFFKKDAATTNAYKIDPTRIIMIGQGSGGYISLAYNFLDKQSETELPKFLDGSGNSVINTGLVGFVDGVGGAVNNYNHAGYSNSICMVGNFGGSMGDISWMDNIWPKVPVAGLHCKKDLFAPYDSGTVVVPTTGQPVVFVHGTRTVVKKAVQQGLNDIWLSPAFTDPYSMRAYALNPAATSEGLFEFLLPNIPASTAQESAPWEWWDSTAAATAASAQGSPYTLSLHTNGLATNPNMSKTKAVAYCDTIVEYLAPRMYRTITNPTLSVEDEMSVQYSAFPNPFTESILLSVSTGNLIENIQVMDISGKVMGVFPNINSINYTLYKSGLAPGNYFLSVKTTQGNFVHKVIIH